MLKRPLGNSGIDASVVAFGAWAIGGWKWGGTDAKASIRAIRAALDAGVDFIDTAAVYGFGLSEELVGEAISDRPRDQVIVATKCGLRWDVDAGTGHLHAESEGRRIVRTLAADSIRKELQHSLKRLRTDYIDLYQTHWPDPATPPETVMGTLIDLQREGLIRSIGFCNSSRPDLVTAAASGELAVDQERYSLLDREREADNLPVCREQQLAFLAYSPMAQGLLSGRIDRQRSFAENDLRRGNPRFSPAALDAVQAVLTPVVALAGDRGVAVEQLVLAWTLRQAGVSHVLVGTRNEMQARTNAAVGAIELDDEELALLDTAAAAWSGFPD